MSTWMVPLLVLAGLVGVFGIGVLLPKAVLRGIRGSLEKRVRERYPDPTAIVRADYSALSYGVHSLGRTQPRGNGVLVLTAKELAFFQLLPHFEIVLALSRITDVSLVHTHLGQATAARMLKVDLEGKKGPDSAAFWVRDPAAFKASIDDRRRAAAR